MSYLLTDPTVVLVVGGTEVDRDWIRSISEARAATDALAVESLEPALSTIDDRDDVGCVVVFDDADESTSETSERAAEWCESIRSRADHLPVLVLSENSDVATTLASLSECRFVPRSASDDAVEAAVDDALETYQSRRREAAESSLFRTLLAESDVPIFAKDEEGRHLYKSDLRNDDTDPEDIVGKTDLEIIDDEDREKAEVAYQDDMSVIESGTGIYAKEEHFGSGEEEYWGQTTKVPWRDDDGDVQGLVGLTTGITWWKQRERQLAAERRRLDRFTKYLAHDLRTPLQIAYGALEPAREGDEEAFDKIKTAHEDLRDIVADLSGLSAGSGREAGAGQSGYDRVSVGIASTHLVPLVEEIWNTMDVESATLSVELPADTVVVTRTETVRPILESLLHNAVDHAGPDVTVRIGATEGRGFFVEDDGPGLPADITDRLREQAPIAAFEGVGTGLMTVAETVRQQGWTLSAGTSRDGGARFEIRECPVITDTLVAADHGDPVELHDTVDVGQVSHEGSAEYDPETDSWHVEAIGENVWGDTNEFHFAYGTATAPVRIQGRITSLDGVDEYSKAGFAIRAGLEPDAPFGYVGTTQSHGSETTWRFAADGHTDSDQFEERADSFGWYRIEYGDETVTCYLSDDGDEWWPVDQRPLDLGEEVHLGLLVCSHDEQQTCEATFESVRASRLNVE